MFVTPIMRIYFSLTLLTCVIATGISQAEDIPIADFLSSSQTAQYRISPDGKTLSLLSKWQGSLNLVVMDIETREPRRITSLKSHSVRTHHWINNERIVFDSNFEGNPSHGLFAVNKDGFSFRILAKPLKAQGNAIFRNLQLLDRYEISEDEILVTSNKRNLYYPDVYRLDTITGKMTLDTRNPGLVTAWSTDWNGRVRLAQAKDPKDGSTTYLLRKGGSDKWSAIARFAYAAPSWSPAIGKHNNSPFSSDGNLLYVSSNIGRSTGALRTLNLETLEFGSIIHEDPTYDVINVLHSNHTKSLAGAAYHSELYKQVWIDPEKQQIQSFLSAKFPEMVSMIVSQSLDEAKLVVASYSDRVRAIYSLISIEEGKLEFELLANAAKLKPARLSEMKPVSFPAHDGLTLHGYLTLPNGREPKNLPLIIHPHGGPWARDSWGYNTEIQFLSNRGFAVLQIDFRSSLGYGRELLHAGDKKWGTDMQEDLVSGLRWAVEQGIADPKRIGIYGASYGGYATLAQLVYHPELYAFGIMSVGPVDLPALINWRKWLGHEQAYASYTRSIGDPKTERDLLYAHSPINFLDRLQAPLMVVHGTQDFRVPIDQAKMLRKELNRLGKDYVWLVKASEGHGFRKPENVKERYEKMEEFLAPFRD